MWPIRLAFLFFFYFLRYIPLLLDCVCTTSFLTRFRFSHYRSSWSSCFSSTTFQNFAGISDLLSEMSKIQRRTKLCSICSWLLASSLHLSHLLVKRVFFLFNAAFAMVVLDLICQDLTSVINKRLKCHLNYFNNCTPTSPPMCGFFKKGKGWPDCVIKFSENIETYIAI